MSQVIPTGDLKLPLLEVVTPWKSKNKSGLFPHLQDVETLTSTPGHTGLLTTRLPTPPLSAFFPQSLYWFDPLPPPPDPADCLRTTPMKSHAMFRFFFPGRVVECQVTNPAGRDTSLRNEFHLLGTPSASWWIKGNFPSSNNDI